MLHHVSVGVRDVASAAEFYDAVLGALGYKRTAQYLPYAIAYGEGISEFWIQLPHDRDAPSPGNGAHVGFCARLSRCLPIATNPTSPACPGTSCISSGSTSAASRPPIRTQTTA